MKSLTARNCYTLIDKNRYEYDDMCIKLDTFYINDRISKIEYDILMQMMNDKKQ